MRAFPMVSLLLALLAANPGTAQTPPPAILIKAARLIDPRASTALSPAAVLTEDGKITRVGTPARVQGDAPAAVYQAGKERSAAEIDDLGRWMFAALHAAGIPPLDILRAVTTNAAEMLGWQDRVGSVEAGKFADLAAVAGDTLADISELERVRFVMKGGQIIRDDFAAR